MLLTGEALCKCRAVGSSGPPSPGASFLGFRGLGLIGFIGFIGFRVDTEFCTYGFGQSNFRLTQGLEFVVGEKVAS